MNRKLGPILFTGLLACTVMATSGCGPGGPRPAGPDMPTPALAVPASDDTGSWKLLDAGHVNAESTAIQIGVIRVGCASGITGKVLEPQVHVDESRIVIRAVLEAQKPGDYFCPGNNTVPMTVKLPGPIGKRELFDSACLDTHLQTTLYCLDGGVRWHP